MLPLYCSGDYVLSCHLTVLGLRWLTLRTGDRVVVKHAELGLLVKRVHQINGERYLLVGENNTSYSTEAMGWVRRQQLVGKVIAHIASKKHAA